MLREGAGAERAVLLERVEDPDIQSIEAFHAAPSTGSGAPTFIGVMTTCVSVATTELAYSNDMKMWLTDNEIVGCIFGGGKTPDGKRVGLFRSESGGAVTEVTGLKTDAQPELKWE